jgi:hypothetical protein
MSSRIAAVTALAERQWGVVSRVQLAEAGYTPDMVYESVGGGRLRLMQRGVYAIGGSPPTWHQAVMAAVLSCGRTAAASHLTAAHLWGLIDRRPDAIEVTVVRGTRLSRPFVVHQSTDLEPDDISRRHRIPVTLPVRTFLDLGCVAGRIRTEDVLDAGLRRGMFTMQEAAELLRRVGRRGRNGAGVAREIMTTRLGLDAVGDSWLEDRFLRLLRAAGLPEPCRQWEVMDAHGRLVCRVDFAWPEHEPPITTELDSERFHLDRATFRRDRQKDRRLRMLGIIPLRFTAWDPQFDGAGVAREVANFLASSGPEIASAHRLTADPRSQFRENGADSAPQMRGCST